MPRLMSKMPTHKFKNKETKLDKSDAINFVWIAEAFFLGVITGIGIGVLLMIMK